MFNLEFFAYWDGRYEFRNVNVSGILSDLLAHGYPRDLDAQKSSDEIVHLSPSERQLRTPPGFAIPYIDLPEYVLRYSIDIQEGGVFGIGKKIVKKYLILGASTEENLRHLASGCGFEVQPASNEIHDKSMKKEDVKFGISSRASSASVTMKEEVKKRPPIEDVKQQVAEWLQERRKEKAPTLKALLAHMRQEPDNGIPHYEFAFHLLAIPLPIMEDGNSSFWNFLNPYLFYHEINEDVVIATDHLNLALNHSITDHLVAAKARYLLISLFMAEHNLYKGFVALQDYPRLKTLTNEMIYEGQKHSRFNPASFEALYIQREGYELLGNRSGVEEMDQAIERAYTLQWNELDETGGSNSSTSSRNDGIQFENKVKRLLLAMGLNATTTKSTRDGGIDIIAHSRSPVFSGKYVIQCKDWAGSVGEPTIRDLFGVVMAERANKGILITSGQITASARQFAEDKQLELIDGNDLQALFRQYGIS